VSIGIEFEIGDKHKESEYAKWYEEVYGESYEWYEDLHKKPTRRLRKDGCFRGFKGDILALSSLARVGQ
jgi:hypothetical protein